MKNRMIETQRQADRMILDGAIWGLVIGLCFAALILTRG